jgi:hypothetical protein
MLYGYLRGYEMKINYGVVGLFIIFLLSISKADMLILNETNLGNIGDTYIYEALPDYQVWSTSNIMGIQADGGAREYSYILFNQTVIATIPAGSTIDDVILRLYLNSAPSNSRDLSAYNTTDGWLSNTITWNNQPSEDALQDTVATGAIFYVFLELNVIDGFIAVYKNGHDFSLRLRDENSGSAYYDLQTKRNTYTPQLFINYTLPSGDITLNVNITSPLNNSEVSYTDQPFNITVTTDSNTYTSSNATLQINGTNSTSVIAINNTSTDLEVPKLIDGFYNLSVFVFNSTTSNSTEIEVEVYLQLYTIYNYSYTFNYSYYNTTTEYLNVTVNNTNNTNTTYLNYSTALTQDQLKAIAKTTWKYADQYQTEYDIQMAKEKSLYMVIEVIIGVEIISVIFIYWLLRSKRR